MDKQRKKLPPVSIRKLNFTTLPNSCQPLDIFHFIQNRVIKPFPTLQWFNVDPSLKMTGGFDRFVIYRQRMATNQFIEAIEPILLPHVYQTPVVNPSFPTMFQTLSINESNRAEKDVYDDDSDEEDDGGDDDASADDSGLPAAANIADCHTDVMILFVRTSHGVPEVFVASSGHAWRIVEEAYWDCKFANFVAKRVLEFKVKDLTTHNLTGSKITEAVSYRPGYGEQPFLWSFLGRIKVSYTMPLRKDSHLYELESFQRITGESKNINVVVGVNSLKFKMNLHLESLEHLLNEISYSKLCNVPADERFFVFEHVKIIPDKQLIFTLNKHLERTLSERPGDAELWGDLYLSYKDYSEWIDASEVTLYCKEARKYVSKYTWSESPPLLQEVLSIIHKMDLVFLYEMNNLYIEFIYKQRCIKPLVYFVEGHLIHDYMSFFKHGGKWMQISGNYMQELEEQFRYCSSTCWINPYPILPLPWIYNHRETLEEPPAHVFDSWVSSWPSESPFVRSTLETLFERAYGQQKEGDYNEGYIIYNNIAKNEWPGCGYLLGDRILVGKVELFDILYYTPDTTYLIHVKEGLGQSTRDVCSQIRVSAEMIFHSLVTNSEYDLLQEMWRSVVNRNVSDYRIKVVEMYSNLGRENFMELFRNRNLVFVLAYRDTRNVPPQDMSTKSTLAKMEIVQLFTDFKKFVPQLQLQICSLSKRDPGWL